ncbi:hypothetical protein [Streptosporangium saharense]|uniref:hypothetical protein n=1 Tax=Streptosporangium saharense TaxID=1706840 RepID=UPI003690A13D
MHLGPWPPEGARNWLRTVPGRGWFGMFRNAYRPGDFVKAGSRTWPTGRRRRRPQTTTAARREPSCRGEPVRTGWPIGAQAIASMPPNRPRSMPSRKPPRLE